MLDVSEELLGQWELSFDAALSRVVVRARCELHPIRTC
jgi:hypothetical protein